MSSIERPRLVPAWVVWSFAAAAMTCSGCAERLVLGLEVDPIEDGGVVPASTHSSATGSTPTSGASLDAGADSAESTRDDEETEEEHDESEEEDESEAFSEVGEHEDLPLEHEESASDDDSASPETREDHTAESEEQSTEVGL